MDAIDRVVEQWAKQKPELDTEPYGHDGAANAHCQIYGNQSGGFT